MADIHVVKAEKVVDGVNEHGTMTGAHHKTIPVSPTIGAGVNMNKTVVENTRHIGEAHGGTWMPGIGFFHGVHGQNPNGRGHLLFGYAEIIHVASSRALGFLDKPKNHGGKNELHGEVHFAARHHKGIGPGHPAAIDH